MKKIIEEFCHGVYDALCSNPGFVDTYSFEIMHTIIYRGIIALIIKLITLILGLIACVLALLEFEISFSTIFWVGFTLWLCWIVSDEDIKRLVRLIKDIEGINKTTKR